LNIVSLQIICASFRTIFGSNALPYTNAVRTRLRISLTRGAAKDSESIQQQMRNELAQRIYDFGTRSRRNIASSLKLSPSRRQSDRATEGPTHPSPGKQMGHFRLPFLYVRCLIHVIVPRLKFRGAQASRASRIHRGKTNKKRGSPAQEPPFNGDERACPPHLYRARCIAARSGARDLDAKTKWAGATQAIASRSPLQCRETRPFLWFWWS